ncbi:hypothetical protein U1Q18_017941 [Sarracenia purpurea var. burkii]
MKCRVLKSIVIQEVPRLRNILELANVVMMVVNMYPDTVIFRLKGENKWSVLLRRREKAKICKRDLRGTNKDNLAIQGDGKEDPRPSGGGEILLPLPLPKGRGGSKALTIKQRKNEGWG